MAANRDLKKLQSLSRGITLVPFSFDVTNGVVSNIKGTGIQGIEKISTGRYRVTLNDQYYQLFHGQASVEYTTDVDRTAIIGAIDLPNRVIDVKTYPPSTGTVADFAELIRIHCLLVMKQVSAD